MIQLTSQLLSLFPDQSDLSERCAARNGAAPGVRLPFATATRLSSSAKWTHRKHVTIERGRAVAP